MLGTRNARGKAFCAVVTCTEFMRSEVEIQGASGNIKLIGMQTDVMGVDKDFVLYP